MKSHADVPDPQRPTSAYILTPGQPVDGNRYRLKRSLGQGGVSTVWLAYDTRLREPVALKFLPPQVAADHAALQALRRETLRSRKLAHPNIVRVYDLHEPANEAPFLSMEYVDGPDFHVLRATRPVPLLPWSYLAPLARQLCSALVYAHGEHVIHSDLKPANLMLDSADRLKLADFGYSRVLQDAATARRFAGRHGGTLCYMSPQQASGQPASISDDIYSFGATLYELLTSTPPFYEGDLAFQVAHTQPPAPAERLLEVALENNIPSSIAALIMACLAKDPGHRPENAQAILTWLDALDQQSPPPATGEGTKDKKSTEKIPPQKPTQAFAPKTEHITPAEPLIGRAKKFLDVIKERIRKISRKTLISILAGCAGLGLISLLFWPGKPQSSKGVNAPPPETGNYEQLFNGSDLSGWDGDTEYWAVVDGALVARSWVTRDSSPRVSCLCWDGPDLDDFELRVRFNCDANSGVFYRARKTGLYSLAGYEAEICPDKAGQLQFVRAGTTQELARPGQKVSIREFGGGDWVEQTGATEETTRFREAYRPGAWNEYVIVAQGARFRHWINGVLITEAVDENMSRFVRAGQIGFQFSPRESGGGAARFKNVRLKRLPQELTSPADSAWVPLFEGTSVDAWRGYNRGAFPTESWKVQDGKLVSRAEGPAVDLVTRERFGNFELVLEWQLTSKANSGIFFHIAEGYREPWRAAPELQLLDDSAFPEGRKAETRTGALYGVLGGAVASVNGQGEFNFSRVVVNGNQVEHWINGRKVLSGDLASLAVRSAVAGWKSFDFEKWGAATHGHIGLQHYGSQVSFRNIHIRRLP